MHCGDTVSQSGMGILIDNIRNDTSLDWFACGDGLTALFEIPCPSSRAAVGILD